MFTTTARIVPVGRGDSLLALHVFRADDLAATRELARLRATVADQALTIAGQAAEIADLEARLAARPRWYAVRVPAVRAPEWALGALGALAGVGAAIDAIWDCRAIGE